jgi:hypothetical protein
MPIDTPLVHDAADAAPTWAGRAPAAVTTASETTAASAAIEQKRFNMHSLLWDYVF